MTFRVYFIDQFFNVVVAVDREAERAFKQALACVICLSTCNSLEMYYCIPFIHIQFILTVIEKVEKNVQKQKHYLTINYL